MKLDLHNPYMVQEWIRRGIAANEKVARDSFNGVGAEDMKERADKAIRSMNESLMSLEGICTLHINQQFRAKLASTPWWKIADRQTLKRTEAAWKMAERDRLIAEARAVESFEF